MPSLLRKEFMERSFRDGSRLNFPAGKTLTIEEINCGSLQRIADATEAMAKEYNELLRMKNLYSRWYEDERNKVAARNRTISNLKGQITKLKKKLNENKEG